MRVRPWAPSLVVCLLLLGTALPAFAVPGDELWADHWNRPGLDGDVWDTVEFQGDLVAVGGFSFAGNVSANGVARYDGTAWSALGQGFDGDVQCAAVFQSELYVGGWFTLADGTPISNLARWNGTQWVGVAALEDFVQDLVVHDGELVALGDFGVAAWDGSNWNELGFMNGYPYAACSDGANLYVVGEFDEIDFTFVSNVARWNGGNWSSIGGVTDDFGDPYNATAEYCTIWNGNLVVTGYFLEAGGQPAENLAMWNGSSWSAVGPDPAYFTDGAFAVGVYGGNLLVTDAFGYVSQYNGSFWNLLASGAYAFSIGNWGSQLVIAGGTFGQVNGVAAQNIVLYDGSTWSATAAGDGASTGVELVYDWNGTLVVGGSRSSYGPVVGSFVAGWDGTQWNALGGPVTATFGGSVNSATTFEGDLVIGGAFSTAGGVAANKIARFDGANWSAMGDGSNSTVHDLIVFGSELYAGMAGTDLSGYQVGHWNGASWETTALTNNSILALEEYAGQLIVGGSFTSIGGQAITALAAWDGTNWTSIGGGVSGGSVWGLAVQDGKLYAAGQFTSAGGSPVERVAVFDGTSWSPLGAGVNNRVFDIATFGGDVFVTGEFVNSGGSPLSYVARWDGTQWDPMGSGLNEEGQALGVYGGELFVGGDFTIAGGTAAVGLSSWSSGATAAPLPFGSTFALRNAGPNPFGERTALSFDLEEPQDVLVTIHDARGRRVQRHVLRGLAAGTHLLPWDGRDARGRPVSAGTYFVRVIAGGESASRKLTVVR